MMFVMTSDIKVGGYSVKPTSVRWKCSVSNFTDTCTITLPLSLYVKTEGITTGNDENVKDIIFNEGMSVEISLGYDGQNTRRFAGFVNRINYTTPLSIECEGYSWQLRKIRITKSYKTTTAKDILLDLISGTDIKLSKAIPDLPLKNVWFKDCPGVKVLDIEKFARIAHKHGVPLVVDNTFATPINCRPFEWGADIVTHSTTKYMDGHATNVGGCIVDSGNFDWEAHADKFPGLCQPDESYHGLTYTKAFGKMAFITKATSQLMRDLGAIQAPQNAFLLNLGLETLHLRVPQHCKNAQAVAEWLEKCDKVAWVNYPGLKSNKYYDLAQKYLPNGSCGVLSFGLKGGRDVAIRFMDHLKLAAIVTHVADARTCVLHPASHTHRQLSDEQLKEAGIAPDLIRFSVGIENVDDIIADIEQALNA